MISFLNLRSSYFDLVEKLESKRDELKKERNKKGSKSNPALIVSIEASIKDLEAGEDKDAIRHPRYSMSQWIAAIDTKINNELKKNGVDKLRPPSEISLELKAIEAEVKKARKEHVQPQLSKARAIAKFDAARAISERDVEREKRARGERQRITLRQAPRLTKRRNGQICQGKILI